MPDKLIPSELAVPNVVTTLAMEEARQGGLPWFDSVFALMSDLNSED